MPSRARDPQAIRATASWGSWSRGAWMFTADLVQRAKLDAAQGLIKSTDVLRAMDQASRSVQSPTRTGRWQSAWQSTSHH
jgi:hypothetical protein